MSATDPEKLKSISERMVRYKKERDIAKSELEGARSRLIAAEFDAKSAVKKMKDLQLQLDNLKTKYEGILNVLRETEVALNEEKKLTSELQSVNLELHQNSCRPLTLKNSSPSVSEW